MVEVATGTVAQRLDYDEYGRVLLATHPGPSDGRPSLELLAQHQGREGAE